MPPTEYLDRQMSSRTCTKVEAFASHSQKVVTVSEHSLGLLLSYGLQRQYQEVSLS
jgi:hypothetical protein